MNLLIKLTETFTLSLDLDELIEMQQDATFRKKVVDGIGEIRSVISDTFLEQLQKQVKQP